MNRFTLVVSIFAIFAISALAACAGPAPSDDGEDGAAAQEDVTVIDIGADDLDVAHLELQFDRAAIFRFVAPAAELPTDRVRIVHDGTFDDLDDILAYARRLSGVDVTGGGAFLITNRVSVLPGPCGEKVWGAPDWWADFTACADFCNELGQGNPLNPEDPYLSGADTTGGGVVEGGGGGSGSGGSGGTTSSTSSSSGSGADGSGGSHGGVANPGPRGGW